MRTLSTIQKREKLNKVRVLDEPGPGGANHVYMIETPDEDVTIQFQCGPRNVEGSTHGVIDTDLLEIVRDRLVSFQNGDFASDYNAQALLHIEEALMWLNRRVEDRIERDVLGKYEK